MNTPPTFLIGYGSRFSPTCTLRVHWYRRVDVPLRRPGMLEIEFWYLLTSALGDAAITGIRVLFIPRIASTTSSAATYIRRDVA